MFEQLLKVMYQTIGFKKRIWIFHGEQFEDFEYDFGDEELSGSEDNGDEMVDVLNDVNQSEFLFEDMNSNGAANNPPSQEECSGRLVDFFSQVGKELYPNCKKFSALTFLVKLMHLKIIDIQSCIVNTVGPKVHKRGV